MKFQGAQKNIENKQQSNLIEEQRIQVLNYLSQDKLLRELLHVSENQLIKVVGFIKDIVLKK